MALRPIKLSRILLHLLSSPLRMCRGSPRHLVGRVSWTYGRVLLREVIVQKLALQKGKQEENPLNALAAVCGSFKAPITERSPYVSSALEAVRFSALDCKKFSVMGSEDHAYQL